MMRDKIIDDRIQRSKYFRKHYLVEEAKLAETQCIKCKCVFAVDYKWVPYEWNEKLFGHQWIVTCPYCGNITREWAG